MNEKSQVRTLPTSSPGTAGAGPDTTPATKKMQDEGP